MAEADSKFRGWTAVQDLQPGDRTWPLTVAGEYFLNMRTGGKALKKAHPQGINPADLLLNLVDAAGNGGDWIPVSETFSAGRKDYSTVTVTDGNGESITIEVEFVH